MAVVEGQMIEVKWGARNKEWFLKKGYIFTKMGDSFYVKLKHLKNGSSQMIQVECDDEKCENIFRTQKRYYDKSVSSHIGAAYCKSCSYKRRSKIKEEKDKKNLANVNHIEIYRDVIKKNLDRFPDSYVKSMTIDQASELVKELIKHLKNNNVITNDNEIPRALSMNTMRKYHLDRICDKFTLRTLLDYTFSGKYKAWEYRSVERGYWSLKENRRNALEWFLKKLKEDDIIVNLDKLPKISYKKYLMRYNLSGILKNYTSFGDLMVDTFPEKYNRWDFPVPKNYYKEENNKKYIMEWLTKKMMEDGLIDSIEDIPSIAHNKIFKHYNLSSFLVHCFRDSPYDAFNYLYPNTWNEWEFSYVPMKFWDKGSNVSKAIRWAIEQGIKDGIIEDLNDLQSYPLRTLLDRYGLSSLFNKYDVYFIISLLFPESFDNTKKRTKINGVSLDSKEEALIHSYIIKNFTNVNIPNKSENLFKNHKENESYVPDWIINKNIIVEYFGMYDSSGTKMIKNYTNKAERKIEYFNSLEGYDFIAIFPNDLKSNMQGVKNKLEVFIK
ncbi:hypothetical protein [Priestia flexa]|uniref:hypothetical protein n=1 Tax=Priestia flexa TaxID=86664 RepID=UPI000473905D|nr:hypothetical protein [Priestia flexa]